MEADKKRERNEEAYRRLKPTIDRTYAKDRFVAIDEGKIIADAARLEDLLGTLRSQGKDPREMLVVQAGVDYPDYVNILLQDTP